MDIQTLTAIARSEAEKNYHGDTSAAISNLQPLAELFAGDPDESPERIDSDWSGAFAYLCMTLAGAELPARYPDPRVSSSFAHARAWEEYAKLPKIHRWHEPHERPGPSVGDLLFFAKKDSDDAQMGFLLAVTPDGYETAEGDYHNHSALVERSTERTPLIGWICINE